MFFQKSVFAKICFQKIDFVVHIFGNSNKLTFKSAQHTFRNNCESDYDYEENMCFIVSRNLIWNR